MIYLYLNNLIKKFLPILIILIFFNNSNYLINFIKYIYHNRDHNKDDSEI